MRTVERVHTSDRPTEVWSGAIMAPRAAPDRPNGAKGRPRPRATACRGDSGIQRGRAPLKPRVLPFFQSELRNDIHPQIVVEEA